MVYLPGWLRSRVLWSIEEAERLKGSAPNTPEIAAVIQINYTTMIAQGYITAFIQNMYRDDNIYADKQFTFWSMTLEGEGKEGYENFSTRFKRLFPGYVLDAEMKVRPGPTTKTINLNFLVDLFRSQDEQLYRENAWMFDGEFRFLDGERNASNKVALISWPRSGNSFTRRYLENLTGITTGADNTLHTEVIS